MSYNKNHIKIRIRNIISNGVVLIVSLGYSSITSQEPLFGF